MNRSILGLLATASTALPAAAQSTLQVPGSFPTIQSAIDAAQSGDTILVGPGTYNERIAFLGKDLQLVSSGGAEVTTLDGSGVLEPIPIQLAGGVGVVIVEPGQTGVSLEGLTITGATDTFFDRAIVALDAQVVMADCIVRDNFSAFGAFWGGGAIYRSEFVNNWSGAAGGAIHGDPAIVDCLIQGNQTSYGPGGGVFATGPTVIIDSLIVDNATGFDGYSGGGVSGPADLFGCVIADNRIGGNPFVSHSGAGLHLVGDVVRCTVVGNRIVTDDCLFCGVGGIRGASSVLDSIVRDNDDLQLESVASVEWSNIGGGALGTGNIDADPLFADADAHDFSLAARSPSIDAGNPAGALDADGTVGDQGAIPHLGPLTVDGFNLQVNLGGVQTLELDAGPSAGGLAYLIAGSASGTSPGTPLGPMSLPLNLDAYTTLTVLSPGASPLTGSLGDLDATGRAAASFVLPAGSPPALIGLGLNHAAVLFDAGGIQAVTNPVPLDLL